MRLVGTCLLFILSAAAQQPALRDYGRLPLVFEPNRGQTDPSVKFLARAGSGTVFLTEREMVFATSDAEPVRMRLAGSRKPEAIHGLEPTGGISNYFIGNDPAKWRTGIPNYGRVEYKSIYAGVDLVYYGNPQKLEYDLVVAPGANTSAIQVEYTGVESLRVDGNGDLVLKTADGELRQKRPIAYQETATGRVEVEVAYRLKGRRVAFKLARYDAGRRLVIDPVFLYSTYVGGSGGNEQLGIAIDSAGNAYLTGSTYSTSFPTTNPLQPNNGGGSWDGFVTKINAAGSARVYSTYLGGSGFDYSYRIAVDGSGSAYVTGNTYSTDFPTHLPLQPSNSGPYDVFVTKINAAGSALVYSTYLGGSSSFENVYGIAADGSGNAYVTGMTGSTNFPTSNPLQAKSGGGFDAFVTKINAAGSALVYSTYLGGAGFDVGIGIAVDSAGNAYVTGQTLSTDFPVTNPLLGGSDGFVTKINPAGSAFVYSTRLAGGRSIAVDRLGNAYVTGSTESTVFPTLNPLQASNGGGFDAFVTKIDVTGSARIFSTYLGGSGNDFGLGIAVDGSANVYVTGYTESPNFPTTNPLQGSNGGYYDAFVTRINASGSASVYSTYLGGTRAEYGRGIAVDSSGNAFVVGYTDSTNFPTANPLQASIAGGADAFVLSISGNSAVAAFRDTSGAIELTSELSTLLSNSGGLFASDPSAAQNASGDTYVVARDPSNAVWINVFDARTRSWDGWTSAGGAMQGVPAVAAIGNVAHIVARDQFNVYWTNVYTRGSGFSGWVSRGGVFVTDPAIGIAACGCRFYVAGKDTHNAIWMQTSLFPFFESGWQLLGSVASGKPSVTVGSDWAAYIAVRDPSNAVWLGRQDGPAFNGWQPGGAALTTDPQVAAAGGGVYVAGLTSNGGVWYNRFVEGTGNNWTSWVNTGGTLASLAAAASTGPQLFLTGRDGANQLWWYETPGAGWKFAGAPGVAAGPLSAAPR